MTCILGLVDGKTVYVGGDSAGTSGDLSQRIIGDKKVFKRDTVVFGVCGSPKVMDALMHVLVVPKRSTGQDVGEYVRKDLVPALKTVLTETGCVSSNEQHPELFEGAIMVGCHGKLFVVESNFQVITNAYGFDSVGSGSDIAIGAMHASMKERNAKKRMLKALEASSINNAGVRPPFTIVSTSRGLF